MALTYEDMVNVEADAETLDESLNEYIYLLPNPEDRLALKLRGPKRRRMILAMGQMAAIFAAARCALIEQEFDDIKDRVLAEAAQDTELERDLRLFYLKNTRKLAGANREALDRLAHFETDYLLAQRIEA